MYRTGRDMSVSAGNSLRFDASGKGAKEMFASLSESTAKYRTSTKAQRFGRSEKFFSPDDPSEEEGGRRS
ncbi:MAG: hypothetical protein JJE47_16575 [Acidimicrobiia bacterium]|nr:hypothetical protein [Acidimicrobiia bacterium]